jgi:flagellar hook protein FlgE
MELFLIALSGLKADSVVLSTIGKISRTLILLHIKGQTASLEDIAYQRIEQSWPGNSIQVGSGTRVSETTTDFSEGTILLTRHSRID